MYLGLNFHTEAYICERAIGSIFFCPFFPPLLLGCFLGGMLAWIFKGTDKF